MFSKFKLTFVFLFVGAFSSCGLKVGESVPKNDVVEIKNTKCLNQSISNIKLFFDGLATDKQVDQSFECFSQVLIAFKNNVNGANRDFFAPEELAYFIEANFLKGEYSFKSEFLSEIMKLKTVLIGGSTTLIYKNDIEQLAFVIDRLRPEIVKLNVQMKIVVNNWSYENLNEAEKEQQFLKAKQSSLRFFEILSKEFARTGQGYEADHFLNLMKEIAVFAKAESSTIQKIETVRPFLIQFKKNLVGDGTVIKSKDWIKVSKSLNEMYFQFLRIKYFLDPLPSEQNEKRWSVYQKITENVVELISTLLDAQDKPVLSNEQVYDLISSVLPVFSKQTIDQQLVDGFSDIKVALLGSSIASRDQWVPKDLNAIKIKIPLLFASIRDISQLFEQLNDPSSNWKNSYTDFVRIEKNANSIALDLINNFDGEYSLYSARLFLASLDRNRLLPGFSLPAKFDGYYKVILSLKYVLTGQQGAELLNLELKHLLNIFSKGYFHYLEYENFIKPFSFQQDKIYFGLELMTVKFKSTLEQVLKFKPNKVIATNELLSVFFNLKNEKIIETELTLDSMSAILQVLWSNILIEPTQRLSGQKLEGFNKDALNVLFSETNLFIQSGKDMHKIFSSDSLLRQMDLLTRIDQLLSQPNSPLQNQSLSELRRVIDGPVGMTMDQNKFLRIFDTSTYQVSDVFQAQIARTLSRILIRSFANDPVNIQLLIGMTLPEAQYFFDSIRNAFFDLDLISSENTTFVSSRFREANLFVSHANGDQLANFEELSDLVIHIFSGLKRAKTLRDQVVTGCLPPVNTPVSGATEISEDCLLQFYFVADRGFESVPRFSEMKKIFTADQNKNYYLSLLKAAGHKQNANKNVTFEDANLFPHVVQYIEVIFAKYDINQDNILIKDEALLAFPVFKSTIKEMLKTIPSGNKITDAELPGVFIYLLKYGKPPKGLGETLNFLGFIKDEKKWIIESNRLDLGVIFNFIADSLAKP